MLWSPSPGSGCWVLGSSRPLSLSTSVMSVRRLFVHKMHGTGNDFVVMDGRVSDVLELFQLDSSGISPLAAQLGHRRFGIGFDQLLLVDHPTDSQKADVFMRIFNSDGSVAEMCGNGVRCVSFFVRHLADKPLMSDTFRVETLSRIVTVSLLSAPKTSIESTFSPSAPSSLVASVVSVRVDMGLPEILSNNVSVPSIMENTFVGYSISMGNPHFVIFLPDQKDASVRLSSLDCFSVTTHGPVIENSTSIFPHKTNVEFVTASSTQSEAVKMRVWERGAGETLSCGSGACAVGAASILRAIALNKPIDNHTVDVHLPGGSLTIEWNPETSNTGQPLHPLYMSGPASLVGKIEIDVMAPS